VRTVAALALLGAAALVMGGVLSGVLPVGWCPDLALVVVVGLGLRRPGPSGLLLAAGLGCLADVLTGALLGQHALLFSLAFVVTRLAGFQLDLSRPLPVGFLVAGVSIVHGIGSVALSRFFAGAATWPSPGRLAGQAAVDALVAPLVLPLLTLVVQALGEDDRRAVPLAPRRREA